MLSYTSLILPRPLVRAKPFACIEEERKVLCESLDSSASNSQHSLTGPPLYAAPLQPEERVRLPANSNPCFCPPSPASCSFVSINSSFD